MLAAGCKMRLPMPKRLPEIRAFGCKPFDGVKILKRQRKGCECKV